MIPKAVIRTDHFAEEQSDVLSRNRTLGLLVADGPWSSNIMKILNSPEGRSPERSEDELLEINSARRSSDAQVQICSSRKADDSGRIRGTGLSEHHRPQVVGRPNRSIIESNALDTAIEPPFQFILKQD